MPNTQLQSRNQKPVLAKMELKSITRLKELKRIIVDGLDATDQLVKTARTKGNEAYAEAIVTGNALLEAKKILGFGKFERWCRENIKRDKTTINRFMRIVSRGAHLSKSHYSLRQAYIELGIIDEPTETQSTATQETSAPKIIIQHKPAVQTDQPTIALPVKASDAIATRSESKLTKADVLSRIKHLTDELQIDLLNKLEAKQATLAELEAATLTPLKKFFTAHRSATANRKKK